MKKEMNLKLMYINAKDDESSAMFKWHGQELTITCKNIEIFNYETKEKISTKDNYRILFEHCHIKMQQLLHTLDIDLFEAWSIFHKYENFSDIGSWEQWENVEHIKDLNLQIKTYDKIKVDIEAFVEEQTGGKY